MVDILSLDEKRIGKWVGLRIGGAWMRGTVSQTWEMGGLFGVVLRFTVDI